MCKLVEDYANMRAAEEAQKAAKETARRGICNGLADRKCSTAGKAFDKGFGKDCG